MSTSPLSGPAGAAVAPEPALPALEHPLPAGMRDLLPEEAESRRALARTLHDAFRVHGYRLVTPPACGLPAACLRPACGLPAACGLDGGG